MANAIVRSVVTLYKELRVPGCLTDVGAEGAAVGSVAQKSRYTSDTFERLQWYEFKQGFTTSFCFKFEGLEGLWGLGDKPALLLVDKDEKVRLAILDSVVGSVKVEMPRISQLTCPSLY